MARLVRATQADLPDIVACLSAQPEKAMFPLSNLREYGLDGTGDYAVAVWLRRDNGQVRDVLSLSNAGMVLPYLPGGDFDNAAAALTGQRLTGMAGPMPDVRGLQAALELTETPCLMDEDEGHFHLSLDDLIVPEGDTHIVPAGPAHRDLLIDWMTDYQLNTLHTQPERARPMAETGVDRALRLGRRVILLQGDQPVATTAFNATLPDIVQIGGVYTPPALRGLGHARRAVALHLDAARETGVRAATLFASSAAAIAAYGAVGFHRIGDWTLSLFRGEVQL